MKVILKQDIPNLGDAGEIKEVADGFARNYLIPKKLVIPATKSTKKALLHQQKLMQIKKEKRKKIIEEVAKSFENIKIIEIPVRVGQKNKLFGSVTSAMIAKAVEEKTGQSIDKRKIQLNESIKQLGEYKIQIHLSEDIKIPITLKVIPHPDSITENQTNENSAN